MAITSIEQLREFYPELTASTDDELVNTYSAEVGENPNVVSALLGVGVGEGQASDEGDFTNALGTFGNQMVGLGAGAVGLAADVTKDLPWVKSAGLSEAHEGVRETMFGIYQNRMEAMEQYQKPQYELQHLLSDEGTAGDWLDASQHYASLGLLNVAGGGLAGVMGKQIAKRGLRAGLRGSLDDATGYAAKKALVKETGDKLGKTGFVAGVGAQAIGQEVGATYGKAGELAIANGGTLDDVDTIRALAGGVASGALEFGADFVLLGMGRFLPKGTAKSASDWVTAGGKLKRLVKGYGTGAVTEGLTEVGQEVIQDLGAGADVTFDEEYNQNLLQAGFAGFMSGGPVRAGTALLEGDSRPPVDKPPPETIESPEGLTGVTTNTTLERLNIGFGEVGYTDESLSELSKAERKELKAERKELHDELQKELDEVFGKAANDRPVLDADGNQQRVVLEGGVEVDLTEGLKIDRANAVADAVIKPYHRTRAELDLEQAHDDELALEAQEAEVGLKNEEQLAREEEFAASDALALEAQEVEKQAELDLMDEERKRDQTFDAEGNLVKPNRPRQTQIRNSVKKAFKEQSGVFIADKNGWEVELSMGQLLQWARGLPLDEIDAVGSAFVMAIDTQGNEVQMPLDPDAPETQVLVDSALKKISNSAQETVTNERAANPAAEEIAQKEKVAAGLADTIYQTDAGKAALKVKKNVKTDGTPRKVLTDRIGRYRAMNVDTLRGSYARSNGPNKALIEEVFAENGWDIYDAKLSKNESKVHLYLQRLASELNIESVQSQTDRSSTFGLSPKAISEQLSTDTDTVSKQAVHNAIKSMDEKFAMQGRESLEAELTAIVEKNQAALNEGVEQRQGAQVTAEEQESVAESEFDTDTYERDLVNDPQQHMSVEKGTSAAGHSSRTERKSVAKVIMGVPELLAKIGEKFTELTAGKDGKGGRDFNDLTLEQKADWVARLEEVDATDKERIQWQLDSEKKAAKQREAQQELAEKFASDPRGSKIIELYNKLADKSRNPESRVHFDQLLPNYKLIVMEFVAEGKGVVRAFDFIDKSIKSDESREGVGSDREADDRGVAEPGDVLAGASGVSEATARQSVEDAKTATQAAKGAKIIFKKRRIIRDGNVMSHLSELGKFIPLTLEAAQAVAKRISRNRKWKQDGWEMHVVKNQDSLPTEIRERLKTPPDGYHRMGFKTAREEVNADTGEVHWKPIAYIFSDSHETAAQIEETILHEVAGHVGSQLYLGKFTAQDLGSSFFSMTSGEYMELAKRLGLAKSLAPYANEEHGSYSELGMTMMDELIAFTVGKKKNRKLVAFAKRLVGEIRQWLRSRGFLELSKVSEGELFVLMKRAEQALQGEKNPKLFGTPHWGELKLDEMLAVEDYGYDTELLYQDGKVDMDALAVEGVELEGLDDAYMDAIGAVAGAELRAKRARSAARLGEAGVSPQYRLIDPNDAPPLMKNAMKTVGEWADDMTGGRATEWTDNITTAFKEKKLGSLSLEQIGQRLKQYPQIQGYISAVHQVQRTAKDYLASSHLLNKHWAQLEHEHPEDVKSMNKIMKDTTMAGYDPTKDRAKTVKQRALKKKYDALHQDVKTLYADVRDRYKKHHDDKVQVLEDAILGAEAQQNGKKLHKLRSELEQMKKVKGPYFPLKRLGKAYAVGMSSQLYKLDVKHKESPLIGRELALWKQLRQDPKHYIVESFSSIGKANTRGRELNAEYGHGYGNLATDFFASESAAIPDIQRIEKYFTSAFNEDPSKSNALAKEKVRSVLAYMYADLMPSTAAVKRQMQREGIAGADEDMRAVFASVAVSDAHQLSRLKHGGEINNALNAVRDLGAHGDQDGTLAKQEIMRRAELIYEQNDSPWVDKLVTASFFAHLGMSPAYILTNMSQVGMITMPYLAGTFGVGDTIKEVGKAYKDATKMIVTNWTKPEEGGTGGWRMELNWDKMLDKGESQMMYELLRRNKLDITLEHDLHSVADGNVFGKTLNIPGSGGVHGMSELLQYVNTPVRISELANRAVTALAAYRLEMARPGGTQSSAQEYAVQAVSESQLDYSGLNAPRYFQRFMGSKALAKMAFQFRKYQQGMLYLIFTSMKDAMWNGNATDKEVEIARRRLTGLFATTSIMGGLMGTPLAGSLAYMLDLAFDTFGDDDEPSDVLAELRNGLASMWGQETATAVMKGLPNLLGVDVSKRIGMGEMLYPVPFARWEDGNPSQNFKEVVFSSLGAGPSYLMNSMEGFRYATEGDFAKAAEKAVPMKLIQNLVKAFRYAGEGMTNRDGEPILDENQFNPAELLLRAAGFSTSQESLYYDANRRREDVKRAVTDTRSTLLREYAQATLDKDFEARKKVQQEIKAFNHRNKKRPSVRIKPSTLRRSVKSRRDNRRARASTGLRTGRQYDEFNDAVQFVEE